MVLRLATPNDLPQVARLYCAAFPERAARFVAARRAPAFWTDYFSLQRDVHPTSFWVADLEGKVAGFALVTLPGARLPARALARSAARAASGRYGVPLRALVAALRALWPGGRPHRPAGFAELAHLDAIAVDPAFAGRGIGGALLGEARRACSASARGLWLRVEAGNERAIRLYEGVGMRRAGGAGDELWMTWEWREPAAAVS